MNANPGSRWLLLEAWFTVAAIRVILWILPFSRVMGAVRGYGPRLSDHASPSAEEIAAAVRSAGRLVPGSSCLTRGLAVHVLLSRAGHPSRLRIGLRQPPGGSLQAHAWVECRGQTILGAEEREGFVPLPALEKK